MQRLDLKPSSCKEILQKGKTWVPLPVSGGSSEAATWAQNIIAPSTGTRATRNRSIHYSWILSGVYKLFMQKAYCFTKLSYFPIYVYEQGQKKKMELMIWMNIFAAYFNFALLRKLKATLFVSVLCNTDFLGCAWEILSIQNDLLAQKKFWYFTNSFVILSIHHSLKLTLNL